MDSLDNFRERFEALERRTQMVEQRLRWWRGIAGSVVVLALLSWALPSGKAVYSQPGGLPERVEALEDKLAAFTFDAASNEVVITGANLHIVNGLGSTGMTSGLGNLIVGYNESRNSPDFPDVRTGSHNLIIGSQNNFSSSGGLVVGVGNEISEEFASVSGGRNNIASGRSSSVSGGVFNTASDTPPGTIASSVSGGSGNTASSLASSVSGGLNRSAPAPFDWAAGDLFSDQ